LLAAGTRWFAGCEDRGLVRGVGWGRFRLAAKELAFAQTELGGFFLVNLTVFSRKITEKVDFSGGLYNLLDKRYADSGGLEHVEVSIPQDGRSFRIKLTYRPHVDSK